jgi:hypothetical protein
MGDGEDRDVIAKIIRAIPPETESAVSVSQLASATGTAESAVIAVAHLINAFGALNVTVDPPAAGWKIKAATPAAALFLRSVAEYVGGDLAILQNWARNGTVEPPYDEHAVLSGAQFLYFMERRRLAADQDATALRTTHVSQVLIKRVGRLHGREYLVVLDPVARQFQLPGGHARAGDRDAGEVARRELLEELPRFRLVAAQHRLVDLGTVDLTAVSRTYGAVTRYVLTIFHLQGHLAAFPIGPDARWVAEDVLLGDNAEVDGMTLNVVGVRRLDRSLAGGLASLPASLHSPRRGAWRELAGRKPLEFWGVVLGIVGIALTIVIFIIQS